LSVRREDSSLSLFTPALVAVQLSHRHDPGPWR
jgi:hypothetical protein